MGIKTLAETSHPYKILQFDFGCWLSQVALYNGRQMIVTGGHVEQSVICVCVYNCHQLDSQADRM